jgi:hypothetical protein
MFAGQYSQVKTPFAQELVVNSFGPLPVLITDVTTYSPFWNSMVDMVPPPTESGSIHFPAKPGIGSWPVPDWFTEVAGGKVAGGNIAGGNVAGSCVAGGNEVGVDAGIRELHEQAMMNSPAMAPIRTSQNFFRVSIWFLLFE